MKVSGERSAISDGLKVKTVKNLQKNELPKYCCKLFDSRNL